MNQVLFHTYIYTMPTFQKYRFPGEWTGEIVYKHYSLVAKDGAEHQVF